MPTNTNAQVQALMAIGLTEEQAVAALAAIKTTTPTAKKVPKFNAYLFPLLKSAFQPKYNDRKTVLTDREKQLKTDIGLETAAQNAAENELQELQKLLMPTGKNAEKIAENRKVRTEELELAIKCHKANFETFANSLTEVQEELATAVDSWEVAIPDFGVMPSHSDILTYFEHKESTARANSGRTETAEKANKTQLKPKYNLTVAVDITKAVCDFLKIEIPSTPTTESTGA